MDYAYRVRDPLGNEHQGSVHAADLQDAQRRLREDGLTVVEIEEDAADFGLFARRVKKSEVIYATNQLAVMVETGVTLSAALSAIIDQEENPTFRKVLTELRTSVEGGEDFSAALARFPKLFDKTYISLVKASEATGMLAEMLDRIAVHLRKDLDTRSKVRAAMMYPSVMIVMAIGVTVFLLSYVLPKFTPLFISRGVALPTPTKVLITMSDALTGYWYFWLAGAIALVLGFIFGRRTEPGRKAWDWVKIHAPILGPTVRKVVISRSLRTLGVLCQGGTSMLDAIKMAGEVSGNYFYEQLWENVLDEVTSGNEIHTALGASPLFPSTLVQMIAAGEDTGKLDSVLARVSDYYDEEVATALKATTSMIEPILISVMGIIVGGIGLALMLPIFSLSRNPG